ncbi:MAG: hypothetical protein ACI9IP_001773 [Arcticibacterium sp.]|jgi:hypothetical protein
MRALGLVFVFALLGTAVSAQHPLYKKGPQAKNYKVLKDSSLKGSQFSIYSQPSEKYASGAKAKNNRITASAEKTVVHPNFGYKRGKGANAKNRFIITRKTIIKAPESDLDTSDNKKNAVRESSII